MDRQNATGKKRVSLVKLLGMFLLQMISVTVGVLLYMNFVKPKSLDITPIGLDMVIAYVISVICLVFICFSKYSRTTVPINILIFTLFTLSVDYYIAMMNSHQFVATVIISVCIAMIIWFVTAVFGWLYVFDITLYGGWLSISVVAILVSELILSFQPSVSGALILGFLSIVLSALYNVYVTQTVFNTNENFRSDENEYMFASTFSYLVTTYMAVRFMLIFYFLEKKDEEL